MTNEKYESSTGAKFVEDTKYFQLKIEMKTTSRNATTE